MFGVGFLELAVIALVAIVVFGPERLPEFARHAAQFVHKARAMATSARDELRTELGPEYADLELRDLDPRNIVRKQISEAMADTANPAQIVSEAFTDDPIAVKVPFDLEAT
jgi:sec-independent protein translocase protein TatB